MRHDARVNPSRGMREQSTSGVCEGEGMVSSESPECLQRASAPHDLGDGLSLEPLTGQLAEEFSAVVEANREHLGRWMTWVWAPFTPEAALRSSA